MHTLPPSNRPIEVCSFGLELASMLWSILGFHVTSEKTKIKNFKFVPLSGKSHF